MFSRWRGFKLEISFDWASQGSLLGPSLFLIYIKDLDDNITSNVLKFADETNIFRRVNNDSDKQHIQNDIDRLMK